MEYANTQLTLHRVTPILFYWHTFCLFNHNLIVTARSTQHLFYYYNGSHIDTTAFNYVFFISTCCTVVRMKTVWRQETAGTTENFAIVETVLEVCHHHCVGAVIICVGPTAVETSVLALFSKMWWHSNFGVTNIPDCVVTSTKYFHSEVFQYHSIGITFD